MAKHQPPTTEQIADLTEAVITLTEQVRCLRLSVDEIESELGWAIRTQVLDRLPAPQYPCDARFELHGQDDPSRSFEHACDPPDEGSESVIDPFTLSSANLSRQAKLW